MPGELIRQFRKRSVTVFMFFFLFQYAHKLAAMSGEHLHTEPSPALSDRLFYL